MIDACYFSPFQQWWSFIVNKVISHSQIDDLNNSEIEVVDEYDIEIDMNEYELSVSVGVLFWPNYPMQKGAVQLEENACSRCPLSMHSARNHA